MIHMPLTTRAATAQEAGNISAAFPYKKHRQRIFGREIAYVEVGEGDPIVLLHGNPTSSYLWRNVIPHLQPLGRCIAPDLIGMGDSDKLPDSGPGSYRFVEHRRYLDALLEALNVRERVILVVHDWGSTLGFDWANRHRDAVRGIAYMEAMVGRQYWDHWDKFGMRPVLQALRSEAGEQMVLQDNFCAQAFPQGRARWNPRRRQGSRTRSKPACADRSDGQRDPFHPGRFAGRDRGSRCRLDEDVNLISAM